MKTMLTSGNRLLIATFLITIASFRIANGSANTAGNGYVGGGNCAIVCPGGQAAGFYCDNSTSNRCAESIGSIAGYGSVDARACGEIGLLRAQSIVESTNPVYGISFSANAHYEDFIAPVMQGITTSTQVIVRATFQILGHRSGLTRAGGDYYIGPQGARFLNNDLPTEHVKSHSFAFTIGGAGFFVGGSLSLTASDCRSPLAGGAADYYSGTRGIRLTELLFLSSNGKILTNILAVGTSGFVYQTRPLTLLLEQQSSGFLNAKVFGTPLTSYAIEATTNLASTEQVSWFSVATNLANAEGIASFLIPTNLHSSESYFRARVR